MKKQQMRLAAFAVSSLDSQTDFKNSQFAVSSSAQLFSSTLQRNSDFDASTKMFANRKRKNKIEKRGINENNYKSKQRRIDCICQQ
jgi:hypothetical protein